MTTENLRNVMATVDAMQTANKEMKKQYKNVNLDKIDVRCCSRVKIGSLTWYFNSNCKTRWKTLSNRQTKSRIHWAALTTCPMTSMKKIWKPVSHIVCWFSEIADNDTSCTIF